MGFLIAYRHTGADPERLEQLLPAVKGAVENAGHQAYCTYFDEEEFQGNGHGPKEIMEHAFKKIEELGGLFILVDGDEKSEGMLMEAGYCIAKNIGFVVAKRVGVTTYLDKMAERSFEYNDIDDLVQKIEGVL